MKHLLLNLILVISTLNVNASIIDPKLTPSDAQSFNLYFGDWNADQVKVQIFTETSVEIMSEMIDLNDIKARKYNLKNLPLGSYTVVVSSDLRSIEHPLTLNRNSVAIDYSKIEKSFKPVFNISDNYVDINFLNLESNTIVKIRDNNGNELITKSYNPRKAITQRFDITELPAGKYFISVNTADNYYSKPFVVK